MAEVKMVKTVFLRATRERVWEYLTEPDLLARWFYEAQGTMEAGKPYALLRENPVTDDPRMLWGDVLEADRPNRLVYTFVHHGQDAGIKGVVEWTLSEINGGTQLIMTHTHKGLSAETAWSEVSGTDVGWDEHLSRLRAAFN